MATTKETSPQDDAINKLEGELSACVQDFHRSSGEGERPVIRLETVSELAKQITSNPEALANCNTFSNVSVLVKQLMESEMVRFDGSEEERIFEILQSVKELIESVRDNVRKL